VSIFSDEMWLVQVSGVNENHKEIAESPSQQIDCCMCSKHISSSFDPTFLQPDENSSVAKTPKLSQCIYACQTVRPIHCLHKETRGILGSGEKATPYSHLSPRNVPVWSVKLFVSGANCRLSLKPHKIHPYGRGVYLLNVPRSSHEKSISASPTSEHRCSPLSSANNTPSIHYGGGQTGLSQRKLSSVVTCFYIQAFRHGRRALTNQTKHQVQRQKSLPDTQIAGRVIQ
jgi:hypothetical protein